MKLSTYENPCQISVGIPMTAVDNSISARAARVVALDFENNEFQFWQGGVD